MIFGDFPSKDATGVMLAHTIEVGDRRFRKGRTLGADDIAILRAAGIATVAGARLDPDDVPENAAAAEIAALLVGPGSTTRAPYTGRCNLHATARSVIRVNAERIDRLNLLDESITVATLPDHAVARNAQVIATVKIIPFAVPRRLLEACREIASGAPLVEAVPLQPQRVALVLSARPGMKDSILRTTAAVSRERIEGLGSRLALELRCGHEAAEIVAALRQSRAAGCDITLIAGATTTKDRKDLVPAAVVAAGGVIEHFGMPVEPGNMLLLAHIGDMPVVILPGCARSRRINGLDWVLRRLLARLQVTRADIMRMGVGGLIRSPLEPDDEAPDEESGDEDSTRSDSGRHVAALVLAAGTSSRMGRANKLLTEVDGVEMVVRAVNAALASRAASVTVVTGHQAEAVEAALAGRHVSYVHNPDFGAGLSTSLRRGVAALPQSAAATVVLLGDMPWITADHVDRIIDAFDPADPTIVVPERDGRRGNPILWPREFFAAMQTIEGDRGARGLLDRHPERIRRISIEDDAIFIDIDSPDELRETRSRAGPGPGMK
ncbi:MAG TPA: molybdopterin-binding/glycosyltransferase family 2 protein [Rhodocyclaceae bacterium]|nr:molybdopterin-binding/glycosyltransferase family 2 protein [Rhodocyclaceae bacterium]HRQ46477.1 molybdopterin-binding/glycosyltransferase family 2 protein [Rhodocyclaceae bacterium]